MKTLNETKRHIISYTFPALMFGALSGAISAAVITIYKWLAKQSVEISEKAYHILNKKPAFLPIRNFAAFIAPTAKISLLVAVCFNSIISSFPAKMTLCSPTIVPPRRE